MSDNERQEIRGERREPSYFAMIPKMALQDLGPYELALYCHYKQTASEHDTCFKSNATLAKETGMSVNRMKQARAALEQLGYIFIERHVDDNGNENQSVTVTIADVWAVNHARQEALKKQRGVSPADRGVSPADTKEEPSKKNPLRKEIAPDGATASKPTTTTPQNVMTPIKDALAAAFGWEWPRMTASEKGQIQKAAKELAAAALTPADVQALYDWCRRQNWPGGFKPTALPGHVQNWRKTTRQPAATAYFRAPADTPADDWTPEARRAAIQQARAALGQGAAR